MQEQTGPVVVEVANPESDTFGSFDQQFHRLGTAIAGMAGVEVGEQLVVPGTDGAGEAVQFGGLGVGADGVEE